MRRNTFDKVSYAAVKAEVIELVKASLPDWGTSQGFIADGIFSTEIYSQQSLKILVLLAETYGYGNCNLIDIESQSYINNILTRHISTVPTINKIAKLLWLIFRSVDANKIFLYNELPATYNNKEKLKEALLKVAWVNVKKESGSQRRQNYSNVYNHAKKNKEILYKQIESIAPELIIVCSDVVMRSVCDFKILGDGLLANKKNQIQLNTRGQMIIHLSHPSYFRHWSYKYLFKYYQVIYSSLCQNVATYPAIF